MSIRERLSGNEAVATAMKQINPDVVAAFPITPSTEIPQYFSTFVANGSVDTEFVAVESEHSAMSACIGAEAAGARAMTATSANGLSLMWEMIYIASSLRLPIVLNLVNRAVSGPLNIHNDHSDAMGVRDAGWVMLFSENNQEAYDNTLMANRIAENKDVQLPIMVCQDGFITSHSIENIELEEDSEVKKFVGEYHPEHYLLNKQEPIAVGPLDLQAYLFEHKAQQAEALKNAKKVILDVSKEFEAWTGRHYGLFEEYKLDDAEIAIVCMNSTAGTTKYVVDNLRAKGIKAGLLKIRVYRPFPGEEVAKALSHLKAIAVLDKSDSLNAIGGALFEDVSSSMYVNNSHVPMCNYVYGIGGRDTTANDIESVYTDLIEIAKNGKVENPYRYLGLRFDRQNFEKILDNDERSERGAK
jgi:pyruvate ferredoxin oxidoreductase alpha subunit